MLFILQVKYSVGTNELLILKTLSAVIFFFFFFLRIGALTHTPSAIKG